MLATGVDFRIGTLESLSTMAIEKNRRVTVIDEGVPDGRVLETEVSLILFLSTAGLATMLTIVVSSVSLYRWIQIVHMFGLKGKIGFSDAIEILALAAGITESDEGVKFGNEVTVGISPTEPQVGPVAQTNEGGSEFMENELMGRLSHMTDRSLIIECTGPS
ncbi:unnamed protein product [Agarophyton chilense]